MSQVKLRRDSGLLEQCDAREAGLACGFFCLQDYRPGSVITADYEVLGGASVNFQSILAFFFYAVFSLGLSLRTGSCSCFDRSRFRSLAQASLATETGLIVCNGLLWLVSLKGVQDGVSNNDRN